MFIHKNPEGWPRSNMERTRIFAMHVPDDDMAHVHDKVGENVASHEIHILRACVNVLEHCTS